jgi:hypothetical protein
LFNVTNFSFLRKLQLHLKNHSLLKDGFETW